MQMEKLSETLNRQQVVQLLLCYREARTLMVANDLGVFRALDGKKLTAGELAAQLKTNERGMGVLLNAAVALGLLEKDGERYQNSAMADTCLAREGPGYLGNLVALDSAFYERWGQLAQAVKHGGRPDEHVRRTDPEWVRIFEGAHIDLAYARAPLIAEAVALPQDRPLRSIDLGGGHGFYSIALAQRYPNLTATVFDLPHVVPFTREVIAGSGCADRVTAQAGNFLTDDLGNGYDLALLFGVMGGQSPENRSRLIARTFAALKPGGQVVLHDAILDPSRTSPKEATLFALWMLIATDSGGVSTTDEFAAALRQAGFAPFKMLAIPGWTDEPLLVAEKPDR